MLKDIKLHKELILKAHIWQEKIIALGDPYCNDSSYYKKYLCNLTECFNKMIENIADKE